MAADGEGAEGGEGEGDDPRLSSLLSAPVAARQTSHTPSLHRHKPPHFVGGEGDGGGGGGGSVHPSLHNAPPPLLPPSLPLLTTHPPATSTSVTALNPSPPPPVRHDPVSLYPFVGEGYDGGEGSGGSGPNNMHLVLLCVSVAAHMHTSFSAFSSGYALIMASHPLETRAYQVHPCELDLSSSHSLGLLVQEQRVAGFSLLFFICLLSLSCLLYGKNKATTYTFPLTQSKRQGTTVTRGHFNIQEHYF